MRLLLRRTEFEEVPLQVLGVVPEAPTNIGDGWTGGGGWGRVYVTGVDW